jgi:hypothetical protein
MKVAVNVHPFLALHESYEVRLGRAEEPSGQHQKRSLPSFVSCFEDLWPGVSASNTQSQSSPSLRCLNGLRPLL